jgi:hypothetical protein
MNTIEQEVRKALADDFGKRAWEVFADPEKLMSILQETSRAVDEDLTTMVTSGEVPVSHYPRVRRLAQEEVHRRCDSSTVSKDAASFWMNDKTFYEKGLGPSYRLVRIIAADEGWELPEAMDSFYETVLREAERVDNVVSYIVKRAEGEDLQTATKPDQLYAAVSNQYETAEEFRKAMTDFKDAVTAFICEIYKQKQGPVVNRKVVAVTVRRVIDMTTVPLIEADSKVIYGE